MALGTPVLVRDLGPLPELVEDGGGLVFSDDEDLTSMMQLIVDDPPLARRLGEQAKCSAAARFADNVFFRGYFRIVADTAARRGIKSLAARARSAAVREEQ